MSPYETFRSRFLYKPELAGYVGVERERFVQKRSTRHIVPEAARIIAHVQDHFKGRYSECFNVQIPGLRDYIGYELSACQIETRTRPVPLSALKGELQQWDYQLGHAFAACGYSELHTEVGPADMPLDVYPDPTGRYQKITKNMPREVLLAACRVIGTHVHIGMPDHETALKVYNFLCERVGELCELGNGSFGERLAIYRQMAPDWKPMPYTSWEHFYEMASLKGFVDDPRKCWTLIRISVHGTIEFRMFGATDNVDRIVSWAKRCHALCMEAMAKT